MNTVKVTLANGHNWVTSANGSDAELSAYFLHVDFDYEAFPSERKSKCVKIEITRPALPDSGNVYWTEAKRPTADYGTHWRDAANRVVFWHGQNAKTAQHTLKVWTKTFVKIHRPLDMSDAKNSARGSALLQAQDRATKEGKSMCVYVAHPEASQVMTPNGQNVWYVRSCDEPAPEDAELFRSVAPGQHIVNSI